MRTPVSFGVIGSGDWGRRVARTVEHLPGTQLRWECDGIGTTRLHERRGIATARFGADIAHLLDDDTLDAVVVATAAPSHYELVWQALQANKHVFVQSPLAASPAEAWELVREAERRARVLTVGDSTLFHPSLRPLKRLLEDGALGDAYYAYANVQTLGGLQHGGDPLWSFGSHVISALLHLLDDQPVEVAARGEAYIQDGVADVVFCYLKFATGITAHLHLSRLDPQELRRLTVVGSRAMAVIDDLEPERKLTVHEKALGVASGSPDEEAAQVRVGDILSPPMSADDPLRLQCETFVSSVRSHFAPPPGARAAAAVVEILDALQRSLDQGGVTEPFIARIAAPGDAPVVALADR